MHDSRLTHTDLKPENILFVSSDYDVTYSPRKVGRFCSPRGGGGSTYRPGSRYL